MTLTEAKTLKTGDYIHHTTNMKTFHICNNGFLKVYNGRTIELYFYSKGCEKIWINAGYKQV